MTAARRRRIAWWVAAAVAVCVALALRDFAAAAIRSQLDPRLWPATTGQRAARGLTNSLMWAALTPLIFALARRVPFRTGHWPRPLVFHLVTGLAITASVSVLFGHYAGSVLRGLGSSEAPGPLPPFWWAGLGAYFATANSSTYWLILAAGIALRAHDEDQEKQRQSAELQRALVVAQVDALKMKLQPHFLFNTLNSISFLAVDKDAEAVVTMVERLGGLLRSSMQSGGRQFVTVGEELLLLDQYLAIEEVRFSDRLRVVRRIDAQASDALLPSLILQPMIENSIKHGFSQRIDASRLEIAIRRDGDTLVVTVEDDGPGLPPGWDLATHCGRGLKNVIERLDKLYPGAWAFTLENRPRGGATARLTVPWRCADENAPAPPLRSPGRSRSYPAAS